MDSCWSLAQYPLNSWNTMEVHLQCVRDSVNHLRNKATTFLFIHRFLDILLGHSAWCRFHWVSWISWLHHPSMKHMKHEFKGGKPGKPLGYCTCIHFPSYHDGAVRSFPTSLSSASLLYPQTRRHGLCAFSDHFPNVLQDGWKSSDPTVGGRVLGNQVYGQVKVRDGFEATQQLRRDSTPLGLKLCCGWQGTW
jgi:hypothetical protein